MPADHRVVRVADIILAGSSGERYRGDEAAYDVPLASLRELPAVLEHANPTHLIRRYVQVHGARLVRDPLNDPGELHAELSPTVRVHGVVLVGGRERPEAGLRIGGQRPPAEDVGVAPLVEQRGRRFGVLTGIGATPRPAVRYQHHVAAVRG